MDVDIENRKIVPSHLTTDPRVIAADKAMSEAVKQGYFIQMFDEWTKKIPEGLAWHC